MSIPKLNLHHCPSIIALSTLHFISSAPALHSPFHPPLATQPHRSHLTSPHRRPTSARSTLASRAKASIKISKAPPSKSHLVKLSRPNHLVDPRLIPPPEEPGSWIQPDWTQAPGRPGNSGIGQHPGSR